ncbi:MAG: thiol oxidoreductase, partial [Kofleriaceae bacterium]|nr:thiol oxidoreductase [Kofleriaceae bacterium]
RGIEGEAGEGSSKAVGEARISVSYTLVKGEFPDGQSFSLRKPTIHFDVLSYGDFSDDVLLSPRVGPSLVGVGFIEMIPEAQIRSLDDPDDKDEDGISGRINQVWSQENNTTMIGRYGLKASTPTLRQQVADAFVNDIGITSSIFPMENCGEKQKSCLLGKSGRGPSSAFEIDDDLLASVVNFVRYFPVPVYAVQELELAQKGEDEFEKAGCQSCHHPSFVTTESSEHPLLSKQEIWPYSDFLLHDMGSGLAGGRPDFDASGTEWRTAPLWGLHWRQGQGLFNNYLHDGRAATVEEAILWHGGEAEQAKEKYIQLSKEQRSSLLYFVGSL